MNESGQANTLMLLPENYDEGSSSDSDDSPVDAEGKSNAYILVAQVWPRLITREQLLKRLWMRWPAVSDQANCLKRFLVSMTMDSLALVDDPSEWAQSDSFFWGVSRISHLAYNFLYLGLLTTDLVALLVMPSTTYRSSLVQILFGFAQNNEPLDASLTSVLGNNRPDTVGFWAGFFSLYILPTLAGIIAARVSANPRLGGEQLGRQEIGVGREKNIFKLVRYAHFYERLSPGDSRKELIVNKLEMSRESRNDVYCFSRFTASYLQWSLGVSGRVSDHIGFNLTVTPFNILAYWNYRRMFFYENSRYHWL